MHSYIAAVTASRRASLAPSQVTLLREGRACMTQNSNRSWEATLADFWLRVLWSVFFLILTVSFRRGCCFLSFKMKLHVYVCHGGIYPRREIYSDAGLEVSDWCRWSLSSRPLISSVPPAAPQIPTWRLNIYR